MENFGIPVSITLMFQWLRHPVWDFSKLRPRGSFYLPQVFLGPSALHSPGMLHRLLPTILSTPLFHWTICQIEIKQFTKIIVLLKVWSLIHLKKKLF